MIRLAHKRLRGAPQNFYMNGEIVRLSREEASDMPDFAVVATVNKDRTAKRLEQSGWVRLPEDAADASDSASESSDAATPASDDSGTPEANAGDDTDESPPLYDLDLLDGTNAEIAAGSLKITDPDHLRMLIEAEGDRDPKPRKGALSALRERLGDLLDGD